MKHTDVSKWTRCKISQKGRQITFLFDYESAADAFMAWYLDVNGEQEFWQCAEMHMEEAS